MKYIEAKGETIDAAVESALLQLGMTRDDVSVEVLQQPKSGFLGFGKEPAIVRVSYETTPTARAVDFLKGLLIRFGTPAEVHAQENVEEHTIALTLISSDWLKPITVGIKVFYGFYFIKWQQLFATSIYATIPVVILFQCIEKHLVAGLTSGGVKG